MSTSEFILSSSIVSSIVSSFSSDSPSLTRYSESVSLSVKWRSSPSFLTMMPSSSPIALNTFKISSSEALRKSIGSSDSSSTSSNSMSISEKSSSSASSSSPAGFKLSSSSESSSASNSNSSCSERDSFTNWEISSFIVDWSIPFAFSAIASSTCFIWISASSTTFLFSCMKIYFFLNKYIQTTKNSFSVV